MNPGSQRRRCHPERLQLALCFDLPPVFPHLIFEHFDGYGVVSFLEEPAPVVYFFEAPGDEQLQAKRLLGIGPEAHLRALPQIGEADGSRVDEGDAAAECSYGELIGGRLDVDGGFGSGGTQESGAKTEIQLSLKSGLSLQEAEAGSGNLDSGTRG